VAHQSLAETDKIQSLAKEPVAPSKSWPLKCSPVPEQFAATASTVSQIAYRQRPGNYAL
jgi:hypothetical protein